jgi:hypothetical protein
VTWWLTYFKSESEPHSNWRSVGRSVGRSVSQSINLGAEPHLGFMTRYLLLFDSYGLVFVGCPLWPEDRSVFCICCWSLPAQSFSGLSPLGLATIFYCLRCDASLFIASYGSQDHGGGIWPCLHMGLTYFTQRFWVYNLGTGLIGNIASNCHALLCAYLLLQKRVYWAVTTQRIMQTCHNIVRC